MVDLYHDGVPVLSTTPEGIKVHGPTIVKRGYCQGYSFLIEDELSKVSGTDNLVELAQRGNMAAFNAMKDGGYRQEDGPFYYGKIGEYGFVISHYDCFGERV